MGKVQMAISTQQEKVVNIIVRVFHWSVAILFVTLFITGDEKNGSDVLHITSGHLLISMIITRVLWGVIGDKNALWSNYLHHPRTIFVYLRGLFLSSEVKFQLHNPAGSSMILLKILLLLIITINGLLLEAASEFSGILLFLAGSISIEQLDLIKNIHNVAAYMMLFVIVVHLFGVGYSSYKYRVNLPLMMITGNINNRRDNE